jgi:hypothetical protein
MIHRTYFIVMPSNPSSMTFLDILPRLVGTMAAPMRIAAGGTTPPAGWQVFGATNGDGQVAEWRGRPINFEALASAGAAGGFNPRFALGWNLGLYPADSAGDGCASQPNHQLSASLVGTLAAPFNVTQIADPTYGPAIRLMNNADVAGRAFIVHLQVMQAKDEDRAETGL